MRSRVFGMRRSGRPSPARRPPRLCRQVAVHDAVDEAGGQRVGGLDRLARDAHVEGLLDADQPRQPLRAFGARDDAEVHLGLAQLRVGHGDAVVPGHRHLEPAAERRAVDRHDDRLGRVFDAPAAARASRARRVAAPGELLEAVDVGAGDEGASCAHDHDGPNGWERVGGRQLTAEAVDDGIRRAHSRGGCR